MLLDRFYGDYRAAEAADDHRNSRPSTISRFLLLGNITTLLCAKNRRVTSTFAAKKVSERTSDDWIKRVITGDGNKQTK